MGQLNLKRVAGYFGGGSQTAGLPPTTLGKTVAGAGVISIVTPAGLSMDFDHAVHLAAAVDVLKRKVERHALPLHLMPEQFTLTALQRTCEAILGYPLDKSVFRRRLKPDPKKPDQFLDLVPVGVKASGITKSSWLYRAREGFEFLE